MNLPAIALPENYLPLPDLLRDRVILVTGAGQGLGMVAALTFARHGATVILHGRNMPKLEAVYDTIESERLRQPAIMPLDFASTSQADLDAFAHVIDVTFRRLDGIFHGASHFTSPMPMLLHDLDAWMQHARINLAVPAGLVRSCLPLLKRAADASVVFLTESHAVLPKAYWGPYAVVKSALGTLAAILADESGGATNPRFNLCLPGPVASPMRAQSHPGELVSAMPSPDSLSAAFTYLMGSDSAGITGQMLDCQRSIA